MRLTSPGIRGAPRVPHLPFASAAVAHSRRRADSRTAATRCGPASSRSFVHVADARPASDLPAGDPSVHGRLDCNRRTPAAPNPPSMIRPRGPPANWRGWESRPGRSAGSTRGGAGNRGERTPCRTGLVRPFLRGFGVQGRRRDARAALTPAPRPSSSHVKRDRATARSSAARRSVTTGKVLKRIHARSRRRLPPEWTAAGATDVDQLARPARRLQVTTTSTSSTTSHDGPTHARPSSSSTSTQALDVPANYGPPRRRRPARWAPTPTASSNLEPRRRSTSSTRQAPRRRRPHHLEHLELVGLRRASTTSTTAPTPTTSSSSTSSTSTSSTTSTTAPHAERRPTSEQRPAPRTSTSSDHEH
jgi:WAS/WASL-interacting protein